MAKEKLITLSSAKAAVEMEWQNCSGKYRPEDIIRETCKALDKVPAAPYGNGYDMAQVLAKVLAHIHLSYPCDELACPACHAEQFRRPRPECWMRYAEAVAAEREEVQNAAAEIKDHADGAPVPIHNVDVKRLIAVTEAMKKLLAASCEKV